MAEHRRVRAIRLALQWAGSAEVCQGGWRLAFLSDLHIGRRLSRVHLEAAELVRKAQPRIVILGGDLVNRPAGWDALRRWLQQLGSARVLAVPGNWEYKRRGGMEVAEKELTALGVQVLRNDVCWLDEDAGVVLAGIDDPRRGRPDWELLRLRLQERAAPGRLVVAVCHSPDILPELPEWVVLLLCGHTHGGQICLPGRRAVLTSTRVGRRFAYGLHRLGPGRYAYVTSGVGATYIPLRVNCPAEVVFVEAAEGVQGEPVVDVVAGGGL